MGEDGKIQQRSIETLGFIYVVNVEKLLTLEDWWRHTGNSFTIFAIMSRSDVNPSQGIHLWAGVGIYISIQSYNPGKSSLDFRRKSSKNCRSFNDREGEGSHIAKTKGRFRSMSI
jgi:hypothetical protein